MIRSHEPDPPRVAIVQAELDRFAHPRYLEVGVFDGALFNNVRADAKVAVDPKIRIPAWRRAVMRIADGARFFEIPSDAYFAALDPEATFDVAFIDGLHLYEQALRDVENALAHLNAEGVVLLHDCNPPEAAVAARDPAVAAADGHKAWCGDVWKAVVHLRATRPDLRVSVLDTDYGIGVVRRGEPLEQLEIAPEEIAGMSFDQLAADRKSLLGLTDVQAGVIAEQE